VKSVLILQGQLAEYRRPVFNALAEEYRVTVMHGGPPNSRPADRFTEQLAPALSVGRFRLQRPGCVTRAVLAHDVCIAMFELAWLSYWLPLLMPWRRRIILYGHRYGASSLANFSRDLLMKRASRLLMYGEEELERMIGAGIDPARIDVAPNTIFVPNTADYSGAPKSSLLYVGRLQQRKRLELAIRSFAGLQGRIDPSVVFDIVGAGEPESELRRCAEEYGLAGQVNFHGAIHDHEQLAQLFQRAFAYVSPGPVGLGVLHSFAFGVPVVTLREGYHGPELHNIEHEVNGLLVDGEQGLEDALLKLCSDPSWARQLGAAAYQHYAGKRSLEHMLAGFRRAIELA
tara:strand:- start:64 stop:1095 length:1032 start_codon:yes stop_codon:yes gene_type:complete